MRYGNRDRSAVRSTVGFAVRTFLLTMAMLIGIGTPANGQTTPPSPTPLSLPEPAVSPELNASDAQSPKTHPSTDTPFLNSSPCDPCQEDLGMNAAPGLAISPSGSTASSNAGEKPPFEIDWRNGFYLQSSDQAFVLHLGGAVQYDAAFYGTNQALQTGPDGVGRFLDGVNLRRGRFRAEGTLYQKIDFLFEMEFFNGFSPAGLPEPVTIGSVSNSPGPTDANITIKEVPVVGNIRIGNQKEFFSLEHLNSYRYLEFLERSYLFDFSQPTAFNNGFSPGISMFRTLFDDRMTMAIGLYKNESDLLGFGLGDGQYATTGRLTFLPIYEEDGRYMVHFGGATSYRDPDRGRVLIRVRDSVRNGPFPFGNVLATTGLINAANQQLFNLESATVAGPWTFQAEYTSNLIRGASVGTGPNLGTLFFQGFYVEALYFLTGEHRPWNPKTATFGRVVPRNPLGFLSSSDCSQGWGAWELGVRYSYLDLTNKGIMGGRLDDITLGLNWYLNPNAKLQFNYDITNRGDVGMAPSGIIHAFGARMAFDF